MKQNRRFLSFILAFIIIFIQFPINTLADSKAIIISDFQIIPDESNEVSPGEIFELKLQLKMNVNKKIKNTKVKIQNSGNFRLIGEDTTKSLFFPEGNYSDYISFKLIYDGGKDTNLPLEILYTDEFAEEMSIFDSIDIFRAKEPISEKEPDKQEDPIDESKYIPNISIVGNKTTLGKSGESVRIPVKIKNTGQSRARNISASITIDDTQGIYIDGSGFDDVNRLSSGDDKNLSFKIQIDQFAEEKTYPINVKFNYYNEYDIPFTNTDIVYLRVSGDGNENQLIVDSVHINPEDGIIPGENMTLGFSIRNLSLIPVRDVQISLEGLDKDSFSLISGTNKSTISGVNSRGTVFSQFSLRASQKLKAGNHELLLKLRYKNLRGQILEEEHKFFIPIKGASKQNSSLIIENIKSPTQIRGNSSANISFDLRNRGQNIARDIIITADLPERDGLVPKSVTTVKIDDLKPGEKRTLNFSFFATKDAPTKNYPINIMVESTDDLKEGEDKYELGQFLGIFVDNPIADENAKSPVPKLIIDKYTFSSDMVEAGKNFDMHLSFYNTNSSKSVKNIKIFLTAEDNISEGDNSPSSGGSVFTPVNSSNTFYIDSIPPKGRVQKSITIFTIPDAAAKTHTITANFEYEDSKAEEYKATELIGVPVFQKSKLEIAELVYFPDAFMGEPIPISAEFYNTGKSTLYNMMVKLEGDFQTENSTYYIGNFNPGTSEYFDGTIIPNIPGELIGDLVFTFEDSMGLVQEERRSFILNVSEMIDEDFPEDFEPEESDGFFSRFKTPIIIVLLILASIGGFKFYKKKRQEQEDRDLLDE